MSEWEQLIAQFFIRAISGVMALVVGTGLCYFLFIGGYLRRLEHYKERLRVYKELDKRCAAIILDVEILLERGLEWVDPFNEKTDKFMEYVKSADRLFMSPSTKVQCEHVLKTLEELSLDRYPRPPAVPEYPPATLSKVDADLRLLRRLLENEIHETRWSVDPDLVKWWSGVRRKLFGKDAS